MLVRRYGWKKRGGANIRQHPTFKSQRITALNTTNWILRITTTTTTIWFYLFILSGDFHDFSARVNKHSHFNTFLNYHWKSVWFLWCFVRFWQRIYMRVCVWPKNSFHNEIEKITKLKAYFCCRFCFFAHLIRCHAFFRLFVLFFSSFLCGKMV